MNIKTIKQIAVVCCVIFTIAVGALVTVQYSEYVKVREEWKSKQMKVENLQQEIDQISKMIERYEQEKEEFAQYLFDERDIPKFLDEISKFAKNEQVNIVDMKTQKFSQVEVPSKSARRKLAQSNSQSSESTDQKLKRILTLASMPIKVNLEGTFESLAKFFDHLQDYKQLINIGNIEIKTSRSYPTLECRFELKI
ncbi:MAG: type 4a pilus biogenesis protein PilO, partial [Candidatus Omnitrophica bacterium]|nr:type 4a pilus biogenesis protein PilO [Candidatus Omnitrophota bacterium]